MTPEEFLFLGDTSGGSRIYHDSQQTVPDSQQRIEKNKQSSLDIVFGT